jgi:molecular chaperone GrpE
MTDENPTNADSVYGDADGETDSAANPASAPPNASGHAENPWGDGAATAPPRTAGRPSNAPDSRSAGGMPPQAESITGDAPPEEEPQAPVDDFKDRRIKALEVIIEERDQTLRDYIAAHKSEKASMEAFKSRLKRDQEQEVKTAAAKKAETLVDVLDNLFLTAQACRDGGDIEALISGVDMVAQQFLTTLESHGVRRIDPVGMPFDPNCMEAMSMIPVTDKAQDNVVLTTVRTGYSLDDRELRPAMVTVGRLL